MLELACRRRRVRTPLVSHRLRMRRQLLVWPIYWLAAAGVVFEDFLAVWAAAEFGLIGETAVEEFVEQVLLPITSTQAEPLGTLEPPLPPPAGSV